MLNLTAAFWHRSSLFHGFLYQLNTMKFSLKNCAFASLSTLRPLRFSSSLLSRTGYFICQPAYANKSVFTQRRFLNTTPKYIWIWKKKKRNNRQKTFSSQKTKIQVNDSIHLLLQANNFQFHRVRANTNVVFSQILRLTIQRNRSIKDKNGFAKKITKVTGFWFKWSVKQLLKSKWTFANNVYSTLAFSQVL